MMIYHKSIASEYRIEFSKKFANFCEKAPILVSYVVGSKGVEIKHENTGNKYFYEWDYEIPVKSFIHKIKQDLSFLHYPRITQKIQVEVPVNADKAAELLASGIDINNIPATESKTVKTVFRIDKVLALQDTIILINENTGEQLRYRMVGTSAIYFLRNYRQGKYANAEEAGDDFFKNSVLEKSLTVRAD